MNFFFLSFFSLLRQNFTLVPRAGVGWGIAAHYNGCLPGSSDSPAWNSQVAGIAGACHYTPITFWIFSKDGCHHVGQAGL